MIRGKVIIVFGPTASGKTQLSLDIADYLSKKHDLKAEVINADSRQVYRGMSIGTNKVHRSLRKKVPHHLVGVAGLDDDFTNTDFEQQARPVAQAVLERGNPPVFVGGTGTWLMTLFGEQYLLNAQETKKGGLDSLMVVPEYTRPELYRKIEQKVEEMFKLGLYQEVLQILKQYGKVPPQLRKTIGYKEFFEYADKGAKRVDRLGQTDLAKIKHRIKEETKRYAMHQDGWLKKLKNHHVVSDKDWIKLLDDFLKE